MTGKPYEHVFSPLRRIFWSNLDIALGVSNDEEHGNKINFGDGEKDKLENCQKYHMEKIKHNAIVKDIRFTPQELKRMKENGMTIPEIQKASQARYDQFRRNVSKAQQQRNDAYGRE